MNNNNNNNNNSNNNHHHHNNNNNHDTIHAKQAQESKDGNAADDTTTVEAVLRASIQQLETAGVDEAADSVHHILSKVLNLSWSRGFVELRNLDASTTTSTTTSTSSGEDDKLARRRLSVEEQALLQSLLARRQQHEPIQYIVGQWDFLDHVFAIVPPLLCPRPETEELVLYAGAAASAEATASPRAATTRILDVGCGTGCIGISLAHGLPAAHVTALDIEPKAVLTARQNAQSILGSTSTSTTTTSSSSSDNEDDDDDDNDERYTVHLCAAQDYFVTDDKHRFDLVVSNPPYIPARDMETLDAVVSQWESHHALCGGSDGLDVIRIILHQLPYWCRQGADCWMEVDPSHPAILQELLEGNDHVEFVSSRRDLQGLDRFVHLRVVQEKNNKE